jgi:hypothetical protein
MHPSYAETEYIYLNLLSNKIVHYLKKYCFGVEIDNGRGLV